MVILQKHPILLSSEAYLLTLDKIYKSEQIHIPKDSKHPNVKSSKLSCWQPTFLNHEGQIDDQANLTWAPFGIAYLIVLVFNPPSSDIVPLSFISALQSFVSALQFFFTALQCHCYSSIFCCSSSLEVSYCCILFFVEFNSVFVKSNSVWSCATIEGV